MVYDYSMDLRTLPDDMAPEERVNERRQRIEGELGVDLARTQIAAEQIGQADEKNCEQMFGAVPVPVGYAGPLKVKFSDGTKTSVHLPLATTEGALVASVNRGCKAVSVSGVRTSSTLHGISRSLAWKTESYGADFIRMLKESQAEWTAIAEGTSGHLTVLSHNIQETGGHVFLTFYADTDEAMGMNMITIAAQAVGAWAEKLADGNARLITVAANIDSDKKPSLQTYEHGRGYEVTAECVLNEETVRDILKSEIALMVDVAHAKLDIGSELAGAIGRNLHAANMVAALYVATGQDPAHVVEGSLTDTAVEVVPEGLKVTVRCPAILVGLRGGGTGLPAQAECLDLLLQPKTTLHRKAQLAESIGAAVLAGEVSLLAAQASQTLAKAHKELGR
jgi:hydroxymethylglutaryl-CoA reductase (NADPH)